MRITISELAEAIDRKPYTIRAWESRGVLPRALLPKRDERGRRYWSETQLDLIKAWVERRQAGFQSVQGARNHRDQLRLLAARVDEIDERVTKMEENYEHTAA